MDLIGFRLINRLCNFILKILLTYINLNLTAFSSLNLVRMGLFWSVLAKT